MRIRSIPGLVILAVWAGCGVTAAGQAGNRRATNQRGDSDLLFSLRADFARLAPQTIHPTAGYIKVPFLIPAGYYGQMWDWEGFFMGAHWANQDAADAKYLRDWVLPGASRRGGHGRSSANSR